MTLVRGCGTRQVDGAYLTVPTGPDGKPLEYFLIDPPIPALMYGLTAEMLARKTLLYQFPPDLWPTLEKLGLDPRAYHILDWIGAEHYPYLPDYLEETRRHGISRRIPTNFEFGKITAGSRLILLHPKAYLRNWQDIAQPLLCLKEKPGHAQVSALDAPPAGPCLYKTYDLIPADDGVSTQTPDPLGRVEYMRRIGETQYAFTPTGEPAQLEPGIFLAIRPAKLVMISLANGELGPKCQGLQRRLDQMQHPHLPYDISEE